MSKMRVEKPCFVNPGFTLGPAQSESASCYGFARRRIEVLLLQLCARCAQVTAIRVLSNIYLASEMPGESLRAANDAVHLVCIHPVAMVCSESADRDSIESKQPLEDHCMLQHCLRQMCKRVHASRLQTRRHAAKSWVGEHNSQERFSAPAATFLTSWNRFLQGLNKCHNMPGLLLRFLSAIKSTSITYHNLF